MLHIENIGHYSILKVTEAGYLKTPTGYAALAYSKADNSTFGKSGLSDIAEAVDYARKMTAANPNSTLEPYFL